MKESGNMRMQECRNVLNFDQSVHAAVNLFMEDTRRCLSNMR